MIGETMPVARRRNRAGDKVLQQFYELLRDRKLHPGDRLLSERELAEHFGVSRPVIRETLQHLDSLELIRIVPGQGTFISDDARPRFLTKYFGLLFALRQITLPDVMAVRIALEAEAARTAAVRATPLHLVTMEQAVTRIETALHDTEFRGYLEAERQFHDSVVSASGNHFLAILYGSLGGLIRKSFAQRDELDVRRQHVAELVACHTAITEAIRARSSHAAVRATHEHFDVAERLFGVDLAVRDVDATVFDPN